MIWAIAATQKGTIIQDASPDPAHGAAEGAKVVVKEYGDFQCPACATTYPVVKDILDDYPDTVRFEWNDYPLPQHANAVDAAIAAECTFDQGKFFEMHDKLFDTQKTWEDYGAQQARDTFRQYAVDLGLDMTAYDSCVTSDSPTDHIEEDQAEGNSARVNATPSFFVNGQRIVTSPLTTNLRKAIDDALAAN
jgi:protein-disulfide isomerase